MMTKYLLLATFMKDDKLQVNVCFLTVQVWQKEH